jgi:hypothetical protein
LNRFLGAEQRPNEYGNDAVIAPVLTGKMCRKTACRPVIINTLTMGGQQVASVLEPCAGYGCKALFVSTGAIFVVVGPKAKIEIGLPIVDILHRLNAK